LRLQNNNVTDLDLASAIFLSILSVFQCDINCYIVSIESFPLDVKRYGSLASEKVENIEDDQKRGSRVFFRFSETGTSGSAGEQDLVGVVYTVISNSSISFTWKFFEPVKNVFPSSPVSLV
jgi:hypothetical protein